MLKSKHTSCEACAFALFIEGVREALRGSQDLLVCGFEGLAKKLQGTCMRCSHPCCEPHPAETSNTGCQHCWWQEWQF